MMPLWPRVGIKSLLAGEVVGAEGGERVGKDADAPGTDAAAAAPKPSSPSDDDEVDYSEQVPSIDLFFVIQVRPPPTFILVLFRILSLKRAVGFFSFSVRASEDNESNVL